MARGLVRQGHSLICPRNEARKRLRNRDDSIQRVSLTGFRPRSHEASQQQQHFAWPMSAGVFAGLQGLEPHQELPTPLPQPESQGHQAVGFATEALQPRSVLDRCLRKARAGHESRPLTESFGPLLVSQVKTLYRLRELLFRSNL